MKASEYSRPTRQALYGKELGSVQVSLVTCRGNDGVQEWIVFNSSKELYFYSFEGVGKVILIRTGLVRNDHNVE